jgi:hypothetical protein
VKLEPNMRVAPADINGHPDFYERFMPARRPEK